MPAPQVTPLTAIYALTPQGLALGLRLAEALGGSLFASASLRAGHDAPPDRPPATWFTSLPALTAETFSRYEAHIFVAATGIAVRCIAPLLGTKTRDPAVLVVDQKARFVISLLSGHLGGANALTVKVADILGATPVVTTATDLEGLPSLDVLAREKGLVPADPADTEGFKTVSAALLAGRTVRLHDPDNWLELAEMPCFVAAEDEGKEGRSPGNILVRVVVSEQDPARFSPSPVTARGGAVNAGEKNAEDAEEGVSLFLHPPVLFTGIGCRRGVSAASIFRAMHEAYAEAGLALAATAALASIDAKDDEPGLEDAARTLGLPIYFFSRDLLASLPVTAPSATVLRQFGIPGVCEPAALAAAMGFQENGDPRQATELPGQTAALDGCDAGSDLLMGRAAYAARLLMPKFALNGVTVAIAMRYKI